MRYFRLISIDNTQILDSKGREVALPDFSGRRIADTHAHLDMLENPVEALVRSALAGVGLIATLVNVNEDFENTQTHLGIWQRQAQSFLDHYSQQQMLNSEREGIPTSTKEAITFTVPEVVIIAGTHPHEASSFTKESEQKIRELLDDPRAVGIGEVGLDFFYDHSPRDVQRKVCEQQLKMAIEMNKPACLHIRDAHDEAVEILEETGVPEAGIILHCYNRGPEILEKFSKFNPYVSFAGPLTFKKADEVRESALLVSEGRILTETDCPFMAPEPLRGQKCEPAFVAFTAARLAQVKGMSLPELADLSYSNARRCLGLS